MNDRSAALDRIFRPRGVVIVGASADTGKRGYQAIAALQQAGFGGQIHPVNPKGGEILGLPVHRAVADVPGDVDLALVCTPAAIVPGVLRECSARGIAGAVVVALGFREAGARGEQLEREISAVIAATGIRVVGPNTSGIVNPHRGLNLIGVPNVPAGRIALLVQSGNLALEMIHAASRRSRTGFSLVVGVGNEIDLRFDEYLDYLADEPNTAAIAMYVEGFRRGRLFLEAAERVAPRKPVILLKGGRSVRGKRAARSHTGALAGSYPVFRAGMRQAGIVQVRRSDELFHVAETMAGQPPFPGGRGIAVLTDGGGHGTLATDALDNLDTTLAEFSDGTVAAIQRELGVELPPGNPVDLAGRSDSDPLVFARTLDLMLADDHVGGVLIVGLFGGYHLRFSADLLPREVAAAQAIVEVGRRHRRPVVVYSLYADQPSEPLAVLRQNGVPVVSSLEVGTRCIVASSERGALLARRRGEVPAAVPGPWAGLAPLRSSGRSSLLESEARELVAAYGLKVVPGILCHDGAASAAALRELGGTGVLKVVSGNVVHKTDAGGVKLNVTAGEAEAAHAAIERSVRAWCATRGMRADLHGVLVTAMLPRPVAELIVGYRRDPHYGGVMMLGLGGVAVEVLKDVTLRLLPLSRADAREMLGEIKAARLLRGHRGSAAVDREALIDAVLALAHCARANPEIAEMEVNPLFVYEHGAVAVDVRVML